MKKLLCLALVLALSLTALSGCRRRGGDEAASGDGEGSFNPDGGPGYTITDGSATAAAPSGNAQADVEGLGDDQPTPEPVETLPPDVLELEKRNAGVEANAPAADGGDAGAEDGGAMPEVSVNNGDDIVLGTYDEAADTASHAAPSIIDTNAYQYSAVMDENVDYTFYYPSHWQNVPGIYTICFREKVEQGDFPARIAVTRKRLVHTPDDEALMDQMVSYMKSVSKQYDKATFQTSTPNREDSFMGQRAFSNTYLAYWGDIEVKGFVIGAAIERTLYVFHFCASYSDYLAMQNMMQYIVKSVRQKEQPS